MNRLQGTCSALVSVDTAPCKAVVGAKLPLKMRTSLLCPSASAELVPDRSVSCHTELCHGASVGCGHAVLTSQVVSGEEGLPAESSAGSTASPWALQRVGFDD